MLLLSGCVGAGGGIGEEVAGVGVLTEDGEFVSQELGYAFRPPDGWTPSASKLENGVTSVDFASASGRSGLQVSAGQPSQELAEAIEEDGEQALEDFADQFAAQNESFVDAESRRTIALSSGQSGVVMDVIPMLEEGVTGGRFLTAIGPEYVYTLTILLGADEAGGEATADAVVESFRILD
jgi:hypothetical protein